MFRFAKLLVLAAALSAPLCGQLPRTFYAWWSSPVARDLRLTPDQQRQIRTTVREYRARLVDLRGQIDRAEGDLEYQFNQQPVNGQKANEAIDRLAGARSELTKTLSRMSLRLRAVLTQEQWQDLQRRRPNGRGAPAAPPAETDQRR